ncbi:MAG: bifunctional UDP-sugar hydrolase/5'-nucleotidase [Candidatus Izemoplasmatales bacterium]
MKKELHILSFSDSHGYLVNQNYSLNQTSENGVSLLASHIQKYKKEDRIVIDTGDTIQGSPLMYFHQLKRTLYPHPTALVYNYLHVDYFIPGNHDFNYCSDYMMQFVNSFEGTMLCGNIVYQENNQPIGLPYEIKEVAPGLKIAIIGLTTDYIPNWERREFIEHLSFLSPLEVLEKSLNEINLLGVSYKIVVYHGGFERDLKTNLPYVDDTLENVGSRILAAFPEINLFLTGHQHRTICEKVGQTIVIQPASHGRIISDISLSFEQVNGDWQLIDEEMQLVPASSLKNDETVRGIMDKISHDLNEFLDIPIGHVVQNDLKISNLFEARLHKHKIVTFINQIQLIYSGAMISATSLGNDITGFNEEISIRNVLSTYVYPNTLTVIKINGRTLKDALEKNAEYFIYEDHIFKFHPKFSYPKLEHYNYDMFDGIHYTIKVTNPVGKRIVSLKYAGIPVDDDQEFTLCLNNYRASGGGEFEMYRGLEIVREISLDIAELMINYILKKQEIIVPQIDNIRVIP